MAREILFKAKRKDNGEWVEGYYVKSVEGYYIVVPNKEESIWGEGIIIGIDESTLCQYTGLTDKNGNKIWENDIIKYIWNKKEKIDVIKYEPPMFTPSNSFRWSLYKDEVIGNIFDNPELLGGGE